MLLIKDAMVLIHLAKTAILEESCIFFKEVTIPEKVKTEVLKENFPETKLIEQMITAQKIQVRSIENKELLNKVHQLNIQRGEAEVVALAWELHADTIATDDDNVRKKKHLLNLNIIGTPAILLTLFQQQQISKDKLYQTIKILRETAWFSSTIWDKIQMEVEKNE